MQRIIQRKMQLDPPEVVQATRIRDMVKGWDTLSVPSVDTLSRIIIRLEKIEAESIRGDCKEIIRETKRIIWEKGENNVKDFEGTNKVHLGGHHIEPIRSKSRDIKS